MQLAAIAQARASGRHVFYDPETETIRQCPENYCLAVRRTTRGPWIPSPDAASPINAHSLSIVLGGSHLNGETIARAVEFAFWGQVTEDICPADLNASYVARYGPISENTKVLCRRLKAEIESRAAEGRPAPGDVVICNGSNWEGKPVAYPTGHLERITDNGRVSICVEPYVPHVTKDGDMNTSGGYWIGFDPSQLKHVGTREKVFWTWGRFPCSNGGVHFRAVVNVWEVTDERVY